MSDQNGPARALLAALEETKGEVKQAWAEFDAMRKSAVAEGVDFSKDKEAFERIDAAGKNYSVAKEKQAELEAKYASAVRWLSEDGPRNPLAAAKADAPRSRTLGDRFIKSDAYAAVRERLNGPSGVKVGDMAPVEVLNRAEVKALFGVTVPEGDESVGNGVILQDRLAGIRETPLLGLDFLSMVTVGSTDSDLVEWVVEDAYVSGAAETAEGDAAAESTLTYTTVTSPVKEITTFMPATRRALADFAQAETLINNRLAYAVRRRLQDQILTGDGIGENLTGVYNQNGILTKSIATDGDDSLLTTLHKAITAIRTTIFAEPNFIGIHPEDWEAIRLLRDDSGAEAGTGGYFYGPPSVAGVQTIWGVPAVVHAAFGQGTPLVGDASQAALWVREGLSISTSDSHDDFFVRRQVAVLAAMRAAFGLVQPAAFCAIES